MMVLILSRNKITPEAVIDPVAQNLEAAGHWRRASTRWLLVMGDFECTEAQREWLLLRGIIALRRYLPLAPVKLDISDVTK
ncbi:PerC family transcriptional regulator [Salmonella enterica subsp. enterica]|nr:PerC family transcriptional regulator [Salmonella enterica]ECC3377790.1 PerC family transcriptional regulator [Salmonella enterica subsp. enterica]EDW3837018.1 PerC family transcriptional regulator [Salmonella enterica subsp. enterica]